MKQKKRLVFCTSPCFYSSLVLNTLLKSPDVEVVATISSTRNLRIKENALISVFRRIAQSGLRYSCYLWFITQGHNLFSRWSRVRSIQTITTRNKIPNYKTNNINSANMKAIVRQASPDILLCAHFNQRVAPGIYSLAKGSALNMHPSLLPNLKGVDPSFYALLGNYQETGVSLHHLDKEFDTGLVISKQAYRIKSADSLFSLNCKLFLAGTDLCLTYLGDDSEDPKIPSSYSSAEKTTKNRYDSWPSTPQVNTFRRSKNLVSFQDIKWLFQTLIPEN